MRSIFLSIWIGFFKEFYFPGWTSMKNIVFKITMFLWVDYERVKISFVISVFNPPEWSPCAFASTTGLCLWQPSKSGVLTQRLRLKTAFANIFGAYPILGYIAHQGLLFTPGLSDAIRKSILHKKCKVLFSCHIPRRSVKICARSNG